MEDGVTTFWISLGIVYGIIGVGVLLVWAIDVWLIQPSKPTPKHVVGKKKKRRRNRF